MNRDAERIEEEIAGAVRGLRPRSLASDYLRQAADALDAAVEVMQAAPVALAA